MSPSQYAFWALMGEMLDQGMSPEETIRTMCGLLARRKRLEKVGGYL